MGSLLKTTAMPCTNPICVSSVICFTTAVQAAPVQLSVRESTVTMAVTMAVTITVKYSTVQYSTVHYSTAVHSLLPSGTL